MTKLDESNPTPPGGGTDRTGEAVRRRFLDVLTDARIKTEGPRFLRPEGEEPHVVPSGEEVATACRLELVAESARRLWLRVGTGEWVYLENPTDAIQASIQAAFCYRERLEVVFRYQSDVIIQLVVRSK